MITDPEYDELMSRIDTIIEMIDGALAAESEIGMNERRSELVDEVQKLVEGAFNTGRGFSMMEPPFELEESMARERANELIALVTAARDAEIREALLSDKAKNASAHEMQELSSQGVIRNHTLAFYGMKAALTAIGLHGDGTGGQG